MEKPGRMEFYQMEIVANGALDLIFGILACLTSIALFLQPLPTFLRMWSTKDTRGILPYPYLVAVCNCIYWMQYASPVTGKTIQFRDFCICCSCAVGCVMTDLYVYTFWMCCKEISRFKLCTVGLIINVTIFLLTPWEALLLESRDSIVGPFVVISGTMFYASPVFTIFESLRTKRVESLPFAYLAISCLNGFVWLVYTRLPSNLDLFVAITNGVGILFSIAQLVLAYEVKSIIDMCTVKQTTDVAEASTPLLES